MLDDLESGAEIARLTEDLLRRADAIVAAEPFSFITIAPSAQTAIGSTGRRAGFGFGFRTRDLGEGGG